MTVRGLLFKFAREAIVTRPYPDGSYKTGPLAGQLKYSQGGGMQTNYSVSPVRPVQADDPPITVKEAVRWSLIGVSEREVTVNRALKVQVTPGQFDAVVCGFYQKGNVPLPDGSIYLPTISGLFNDGDPDGAISAFLRFGCGADNVLTVGHMRRRGAEGFVAYDNYGNLSEVPFWETLPLTKENRQSIDASEIAKIIRELDPTRDD